MVKESQGQNLSEYALPLALVGVLAVGILAPMGGTISAMFSSSITHRTGGATLVSTTGTSSTTNSGTGSSTASGSTGGALVANPFPNLTTDQVTLDLGRIDIRPSNALPALLIASTSLRTFCTRLVSALRALASHPMA